MKPRQFLISFYLDFVNDFLTVKRMAEYYDIPEEDCASLIEMGKKLHEDSVSPLRNRYH